MPRSLSALFASALFAAVLGLNPGRFAPADEGAAADEPPSPYQFVKLVGKLHEEKSKVRQEWLAGDVSTLTPAASAVLKVATAQGLSRKKLKTELAAAGEKYKAIPRNLDVGRHQLLKVLCAKAIKEANSRLAKDKMAPLNRVTTLNSGGTGDYTRDVDITIFAMDDARETAFFEALLDEAKKAGLKVEVDEKLGVKAGINIPEIEVAFHRGQNDVPDARYATDVHTFALDYRKAIEFQAKNPEAYFGYGFEMEVQGRRSLSFKPGQTLVQEFQCPDGQTVTYTGQIATCHREARAIIRGAVGQRYRRAQSATHITNDYLQAFRHGQHEGADLSKGALKYAGRAIEQLCEFHGMKNWSELVMEDRIQLLSHLFPPGYLDEPGGRARLAKMADSMDVAYMTFQGKAVPEKSGSWGFKTAELDENGKPKVRPMDAQEADSHSQIALIFLRKAAAATAGAVAKEMIDPPAYDPRMLAQINEADGAWNKMNAAERDAAARQRDATYRKCVSIAAMENLLVLVHQIKLLDLPEFNNKGTLPGRDALKQMIEQADEGTRPLLLLAEEHAEAAVEHERATDPKVRAEAARKMEAVRAKMRGKLPGGSPGEDLIERVTPAGPRNYVRDRVQQKPAPWSPALEEMRVRLKAHLDESFPPTDLAAFRLAIKEKGYKGYARERLIQEAFSMNNIVDALTLIELYQNGAGMAEYGLAITTSVLSRVHWSLGFLIQAGQVKTGHDVRELGKNLVFDAFARVIPGVMTVKIIFDIERGIVNVTVGYTFNQLNASLIDALYTGEAGRLNDGTAGKAAGRIRDSGVCVLDAKYVKQVTDEKSGKVTIAIDRQALYLDLFAAWTAPSGKKIEHDELSRDAIAGPVGKFLKAHDDLVKAIQNQGESEEAGWFGRTAKGRADEKEMDRAMEAYRAALAERCRPMAQNVLNELAPREFYKDGKDQIEEGLHSRLLGDVLLGMIQVWQTHQLEQTLAKREVEQMAEMADSGEIAKELSGPPRGSETDPGYDIDLGLNQPSLEAVIDANEPVPLTCTLTSKHPSPVDVSDVVFEVEAKPFEPLTRGAEIKPGDVVTQQVIVKALAGGGSGPELVKKVLTLKVRLPDDLLARLKAAKRLEVTYSGPVAFTSTDSENASNNKTSTYHDSLVVGIDPMNSKKPDTPVTVSWSGNSFTATAVRKGTENGWTYSNVQRITGTIDLKKKCIIIEASDESSNSSGGFDRGIGASGAERSSSMERKSSLSARSIPLGTGTDTDIVFYLQGQKALQKAQARAAWSSEDKSSVGPSTQIGGGESPGSSRENTEERHLDLNLNADWNGKNDEGFVVTPAYFKVVFSTTSYQEFIDKVREDSNK